MRLLASFLPNSVGFKDEGECLPVLLGSCLRSGPKAGLNETQVKAGLLGILNGGVNVGPHVEPFAGFAACLRRACGRRRDPMPIPATMALATGAREGDAKRGPLPKRKARALTLPRAQS